MGDLTKNFSLYEFYSSDGATFTLDIRDNVLRLAENLQVLRDYFRLSVSIESGYRSPEHNQWLIDNGYPAVPNSRHLLGIAADIKVPGKTPEQIKSAIEYLIYRGLMQQGGIGIYNTFVHYDIRTDSLGKQKKSRWDKRTR
jgi:uncharacterized protein YcbK (DUF882 family)